MDNFEQELQKIEIDMENLNLKKVELERQIKKRDLFIHKEDPQHIIETEGASICDISVLNGKVILSICCRKYNKEVEDGLVNGAIIVLITAEDSDTGELLYVALTGKDYREDTYLEDFGVLGSVLDSTAINVYSTTGGIVKPDEYSTDREQWTFYIIHTTKGSIWMRWLSSDNGYYSVDIECKVVTI